MVLVKTCPKCGRIYDPKCAPVACTACEAPLEDLNLQ